MVDTTNGDSEVSPGRTSFKTPNVGKVEQLGIVLMVFEAGSRFMFENAVMYLRGQFALEDFDSHCAIQRSYICSGRN